MQWWCSTREGVWDGSWQPYIGVWLLIVLLAIWYRYMHRRFAPVAEDRTNNRRRMGAFAAGLAALWAGLDWPLGPLSASLASIHMVQYLLIGLVTPALMLLGMPPAAYRQLRRHPRIYRALETTSLPLMAFVLYSIIISIMHWPTVVDALMPTQLGSFVLDMTWLLLGLLFWWPIIAPLPPHPRFNNLLKILYLGVNIVIIRPPVLLMLYSKFPAYATYELAPPIPGAGTPLDDQQLAAAIMKAGSAWIMVVGITILFIMWHRQHARQ